MYVLLLMASLIVGGTFVNLECTNYVDIIFLLYCQPIVFSSGSASFKSSWTWFGQISSASFGANADDRHKVQCARRSPRCCLACSRYGFDAGRYTTSPGKWRSNEFRERSVVIDLCLFPIFCLLVVLASANVYLFFPVFRTSPSFFLFVSCAIIY